VAEAPVHEQRGHAQHARHHQARPCGSRGAEAQEQDEQGDEEEAPAVGQQPGEDADGEGQCDDQPAAAEPVGAAHRVPARVRQEDAGADDQEEDCGQDEEGGAADDGRGQPAHERPRQAAGDRQARHPPVEVAPAQVAAGRGHRGGQHRR
jgi:hypothetical protein